MIDKNQQPPQSSPPILLYDGVCGLCNRLVQFVVRHDHNAIFRFAALQSSLAARILARHGANAADLDTVYVVLNYVAGHEKQPDEVLLARSDAILYLLRRLGRSWSLVAFLMSLLPRFLRDWGYNQVARFRYRLFGRYDSCPLPSVETRHRFLDS